MTLRLNDSGSSVKELQNALNTAGYSLAVDGVFGQKTYEAVKDYQTKQGFTASGEVDSDLWKSLNGESTTSQNNTSETLLKLMEHFNSTSGYTPKTAEQIREQAAGEYDSYYDTLRQTAQNTFDRSDLALQQQKEGLGATYDKQREDSAKQYAKAYSQTDRAMLGRGMQRSSYAAQTLANLLQEGAEAQQDISDAQAAAEGDIDAQRALLAEQLAAQLGQYDASEQADILARIRELADQEYDRSQTAQNREDSIALQLYQLMYQEGRDKVADEQWTKQFEESVRQYNERYGSSSGSSGSSGGSGSSGSSGGSGSSTNGSAANAGASANSSTTPSSSYQAFMDAMNAGATGGANPATPDFSSAAAALVAGASSASKPATTKKAPFHHIMKP